MKQAKQTSWTRLVVDHYSALTVFFRRRIPQPCEAEDLVQEAYLRLIRSDQGADGSIHNPEAYLFTVASNLVREHAVLRKRASLNVDVDDVAPEWLAVEDTAAANLDSSRRHRQIAGVLGTLPVAQRAAMVLHYREGLTYQQVAEHMGTSAHMVKKHIARGLVAFRMSLANEQGGD
jgi:RNA polymerase sigma-70 factor (ECF subfamily)